VRSAPGAGGAASASVRARVADGASALPALGVPATSLWRFRNGTLNLPQELETR
jgi:hypothetical protein